MRAEKSKKKKMLGKHKREEFDIDEIIPELKRRKLSVNEEDRKLFDGKHFIDKASDNCKKIIKDFLIKVVTVFPHVAKNAVNRADTNFVITKIEETDDLGFICKSKKARFEIIETLEKSEIINNYAIEWCVLIRNEGRRIVTICELHATVK
jgi:hypothetical protein